MKAAATAIRNSMDPEAAIDEAGGLAEAYRAMWKESALDFAGVTFNEITSSTKDFTEAELERWVERVNRYLEQEGAERIVLIDSTTKEFVRNFLQQAEAQGWGADKAARELMKTWGDLSAARAKRIVRTEVVGASNWGQLEGAKETGLDMVKVWLTTVDERTRRDEYNHAFMNGKKIPLSEAFVVSGERMMHPGDPSLGASAGNIINCRCTIGFEVL